MTSLPSERLQAARYNGSIRECSADEMQAAILHGRRVLIRTGVYGYRYGDYIYLPKEAQP